MTKVLSIVHRILGLMVGIFLLSALGSSAAFAALSTDEANSNCIFNWAERTYPQYFSPPTASQTYEPYYYRHYTDQNSYLGLDHSNRHIYYIGPLSQGQIVDLGPLSKWQTESGCGAPISSGANWVGDALEKWSIAAGAFTEVSAHVEWELASRNGSKEIYQVKSGNVTARILPGNLGGGCSTPGASRTFTLVPDDGELIIDTATNNYTGLGVFNRDEPNFTMMSYTVNCPNLSATASAPVYSLWMWANDKDYPYTGSPLTGSKSESFSGGITHQNTWSFTKQ